MNLHKQYTTAKQLLEALSERACLWHSADAGEETAPPQNADVTTAGDQQQQPQQDHHQQQQKQQQKQEQQQDQQQHDHYQRQEQQQQQQRFAKSVSFSPTHRSTPAAGTSAFAAAAGRTSFGPAARTKSSIKQSQLLLLQQALFPLTCSRHKGEGAVLRDDDLRPHAEPKAQQVYETLVKGVQHRPWYMLRPEGRCRLLWDFMLFVFTAGLLLYTPILVAFYASMSRCAYLWSHDADHIAPEAHVPPPTNAGVTFMTLTNAAFLLDIPLNFLTGVVSYNLETGLLETNYSLTAVAACYARTWLVIDIVSCLPMECMIAAGGIYYTYNLGHLNRLLKATTLLRRAHGDPFRVVNHIPVIKRNFNYSVRLVIVAVSLLLLGLHYFACGLWLTLRIQAFPSHTWPVQLGIVGGEDVYKQWTWCFFSVTSAMIGLGYGSYPPETYPEAVLWIVAMICLAGGFAVVNGFIFSAVLESLADNARYKTQLIRATKEVQIRRLSPALSERVINYYKLKHSRQSAHMPIASIIDKLEPGLRLQVALASVGALLRGVPVLRDCPQLLQRVALLVEPQVAAEGQLIGIPGSPANHLYFLTRGYADVYFGNLLIDTLAAGDSFCEAALLPVPDSHQLPPRLRALWSSSGSCCFSSASWPCLFAVKALSNCNLMVLERDKFIKLVAEYSAAQDAFLDLGVEYAQTLSELPMLEELWQSAAAFDPLTDQLAFSVAPLARKQLLLQQLSGGRRVGVGEGGGALMARCQSLWQQLRHHQQQQRQQSQPEPMHEPV